MFSFSYFLTEFHLSALLLISEITVLVLLTFKRSLSPLSPIYLPSLSLSLSLMIILPASLPHAEITGLDPKKC